MSRYRESELHLTRAEKVIPLGSQTFSKSKLQYAPGISPLYLSKGMGSKVWDVDGNKFLDMVNSLACIVLGYGDRGIERAVKKQLKRGVSLSLPGKIEAEVAEMLITLIPSAQMVRFAKNGSDATSGAIRLARAFTGRDHIIVCGYHGWQDWYIGTTSRNKGVPSLVSSLTHHFDFNDIDSLIQKLHQLNNNVAAVIMEPMSKFYPVPGFLAKVKEVTNNAGALLIFDETITGFRFSSGGAQKLFDVIPDISTFGKGIANGFPLSAIVGRADIMGEMEEIFFSSTFGGELLSLVAAREVCKRFIETPVASILNNTGTKIINEIEKLSSFKKLNGLVTFSGHPSWKFINFSETSQYTVSQLRTLFMQNMIKNNILILASHNISLAHSEKDIKKIVNSYDETLELIRFVVENNNLNDFLLVSPLEPIFNIR